MQLGNVCIHSASRSSKSARVPGSGRRSKRRAALRRARGHEGWEGVEEVPPCCRERSQRGQLVARAGRKVVQQIGGSKRAKDWDRVGNREAGKLTPIAAPVSSRRRGLQGGRDQRHHIGGPGKLIVERIVRTGPGKQIA